MKHRHLVLFAVIVAFGVLSGCARFSARSSSSVPLASIIATTQDSRQTMQKASLTFPASVAVIFVPGKSHIVPETVLHQAEQKLREQLLAKPKYIRSVSIVSTDVMRAKVSLTQIRAMYDADIAIILSYKQDQLQTQSGPGGLMDATLIGSFVVPSVETKTSTLIDGSVVHIPNNAVIFRAGGSAERKAYSTSYGVTATLALPICLIDSIIMISPKRFLCPSPGWIVRRAKPQRDLRVINGAMSTTSSWAVAAAWIC